MKNLTLKSRNIIIAVLSIVLVLSSMCFFMLGISEKAYASDATKVYKLDGAAVRLASSEQSDDSGIRFIATLNKSYFDSVVVENETVYFGIAVAPKGNSTVKYFEKVNATGTTGLSEVSFDKDGICKLYGAIMYNTAKLKKDLATSQAHNPDYSNYETDELRIEKFDNDLLTRYLNKIYATELTATLYYKVGENGEPVVVDEITRSIWGVAAMHYSATLNSEEEFGMDKYFSQLPDSADEGYTVRDDGLVKLNGEVSNFTEAEGDTVYVGSSKSLSNDKVDGIDFSNWEKGDEIYVSVISKTGELSLKKASYNPRTFVTITDETVYDATENIVYYRDGDNAKQTVGGDATKVYWVDNGESRELAKGSITYAFANSVSFYKSQAADQNAPEFRMASINPKITPVGSATAYDQVIYYGSNGYMSAGAALANIDAKSAPSGEVKAQSNRASYAETYYGGLSMRVEDDVNDLVYVFNKVVPATAVIDTGAELKSIFNKPDNSFASAQLYYNNCKYYGNITKGVYMLFDNIDASQEGSAFVFDNSDYNYFEGVFDGRGYNIANLDLSDKNQVGGNGLFSAMSRYCTVQNVGFTNVRADYGSVFQGNLRDYGSGINIENTYGTTQKGNEHSTYDAQKVYLKQFTQDETADMSSYLLQTSRNYQFGNFANVYVQVSPKTIRFKGVISKNLPTGAWINGAQQTGAVIAHNMLVEYEPEILNDEGEVKGALPAGYDYTVATGGYTGTNHQYSDSSKFITANQDAGYGVLFGMAATHVSGCAWAHDCGCSHTDCGANDGSWYAMNIRSSDTWAWAQVGALQFGGEYEAHAYGYSFANIMIISPVLPVSTASGAIGAMNDDTTLKFAYRAQLPSQAYKVYGKMNRYDSVEAYKANCKYSRTELWSMIGNTTTAASNMKFIEVADGKGYYDWTNTYGKA